MMTLHNSHVNLSEGSIDLVQYLVTDSLDLGVVARKIAETRLCTYASPGYIEGNTANRKTIEELKFHHCLYNTDTPHKDYWIFKVGDDEEAKVKTTWRFASNNGRALCQAAALGMGITQTPELVCGELILAQGEAGGNIAVPTVSRRLAIYATYLQRRFHTCQIDDFCGFFNRLFC